MKYTRRAWLGSAMGAVAALAMGRRAHGISLREHELLVYKSPSCGCCKLWVDHMAAAGFGTSVRDVADVTPLKRDLGVPAALASCHTALVDGYVVEGHVPADVVLQLLEQRPIAVGLAVPGMPMGSPGMEGPVKQPYEILLFQRDGTHRVYASR